MKKSIITASMGVNKVSSSANQMHLVDWSLEVVITSTKAEVLGVFWSWAFRSVYTTLQFSQEWTSQQIPPNLPDCAMLIETAKKPESYI